MAIEEGNTNEGISAEEFKDLYEKLLADINSSDGLKTIEGAPYKIVIGRIIRESDLGQHYKSIVESGFDKMAQAAKDVMPRTSPYERPSPARLPFDPPREPRDPFRESKDLVYVKEGKAYISKDDLLQIIKEELLTTLSFDKD